MAQPGSNSSPDQRDVPPHPASHAHASLPTAATLAGAIAALYFGRDVFLPIAVALLLTFALAPLVSALRRVGIPRIVAVIGSVVLAFAALALFSIIVATQVGELARNVTTYQFNILTKVRSLKDMGAGSGIVERLSGVIERVGREIDKKEAAAPSQGEASQSDPLPVEIVARQKPLEVLQNLILPLVSPLATTGLIIIVLIFMLLERENLRDRFIRLVGYGDLHRTTAALQDAGQRVGQYLLMQLVVNVVYAIPITIGLWLLDIPNALLWGVLALVLRFVPYIGPAIAMLLPMLLALAVAPGWSLVLWTGALFLLMELISNNVVEPWLYGSRTGLSPLAIIVAAIFWTWLWGPLGLILSTPLTVCLVVLGRHVPQFEFFEVLLGNEPVLEPKERLYQRLLAGDPEEATDHAEETLEEKYLIDFYQDVVIPALLLAEQDRVRGVMADDQTRRVAASALILVANLEDVAEDEASEEGEDDQTIDAIPVTQDQQESKAEEGKAADHDLPDGVGKSVLCVGGRGELDDATAAMLAQVLGVQGAIAVKASFADLAPGRMAHLSTAELHAIVVSFLNSNSLKHARFLVRRLKRTRPASRVGIVFWSAPGAGKLDADELARDLNADFVAFGMANAVSGALSDDPAVPVRTYAKRVVRLPTRAPKRPATTAA